MAIIVATLLLFLAGPFVLWPLLKTPQDIDTSSPTALRGDLPGKRGGESQ
jgi:hypothetical protein